MKLSRFAATLASAALLFASAAFAAEANKTTVRIDQKVTVDGKTLDSGKYTAEWTGDGPNVQVTLMHGKETVATFAAQIKPEATPNPVDAVGTTDAGLTMDGTRPPVIVHALVEWGGTSARPSAARSWAAGRSGARRCRLGARRRRDAARGVEDIEQFDAVVFGPDIAQPMPDIATQHE